MKKSINIAAQQVIFTFDDLPSVTLHIDKISDANLEYAQYHGLMARVGDAAAIARKQGDVVITVTEAMRREAVTALVDHYESGSDQWETRSSAPKFNPAIQRLAAKLGKSYDEAKAWLAEDAISELSA